MNDEDRGALVLLTAVLTVGLALRRARQRSTAKRAVPTRPEPYWPKGWLEYPRSTGGDHYGPHKPDPRDGLPRHLGGKAKYWWENDR